MNNMHIKIDITGLPEALAADLQHQMEAMVEKARADLPVSFKARVDRALYELPEELGEIADSGALAKILTTELQAHFDKLGFIDTISKQAESCINWNEEEFDDEEFEHQVSVALNRFFI